MRKEKKDNMKKLLSTIAILLLFISAIGMTFNFAPKVYAATWHLDVFTSPAEVNDYIPGGIVGTGNYPVGWTGPVTAPTPVDKGVHDTQWRFDHWEENGTDKGSVNPTTFPTLGPAAGDYINVTAVYKTCYWLEIITPRSSPNPAYVGWWWAGSTAYASLLAGYVWEAWGIQHLFDHWEGDASGTNFALSNGITMDSRKVAIAVWRTEYYILVTSELELPGPGAGPAIPGTGWYATGVSVPLSAPLYDGGDMVTWRYIFARWELDGSLYSKNRDITVTMLGPHKATAFYRGQDYVTFNDNIGGISCVSTLNGWYNWSTTYTLWPPVPAPIAAGAGAQFRWAWWDLNGVFHANTETMQYHPTGPADILTARYQTQYYVKLDTTAPPGLPTKVVIKGSDIIGTPPIGGWFDAGTTVNFLVPDVAELVPGDHMWRFDTDAGKQWWLNGFYWGPGAMWNATWRQTGGALLNQPMNVTANYKRFYYFERDTAPVSNLGGWKGSWWLPEGMTFWTDTPPGSVGVWVFKELFDNGVSQGIGVNSFYCTMNRAHTVIAEYVNATAFYITSPAPFTAPKYCTTFDVFVYAANFDIERGRDLYAMDFMIKYNTTLIKLVAVEWEPYLNQLWGTNKWFVAKNESGHWLGWDTFWFVATALKDAVGFQGTKPVLKLTFHIELDPCYPTVYTTPIDFIWTVLTNSTTNVITPEQSYGATYTISAPQPIVEVVLDKTPIQTNVPQQFFHASVDIKLGIKVTDFHIEITYPKCYIEPVSVTFGDYLPGPAFISRGYTFDKATGRITVWAQQDTTQSPHATGNGTLFIIEFKVIMATFWQNPDLTGKIDIDDANSWLSVCCPFPKIQHFNPDVLVHDAVYVYKPLPGDLNFDGVVNVADLRLLAARYAPMWWVPTGWPYDVNCDHYVNIIDLVLVAQHFGDHI